MRSAGELPDVAKFPSVVGGGCTQHGETKNAEEICEKIKTADEHEHERRQHAGKCKGMRKQPL